MFLLLLKVEHPSTTSLGFVGMYESQEEAERLNSVHGFRESGHGNRRMLGARGSLPVKSLLATDTEVDGDDRYSYLLAEY